MHEFMINRLRRHVGAILVLKRVLGWLTLWCFLWGTVVLVSRILLAEIPAWLWWGLGIGPLVAIVAGWFALGRLPSRSAFRALVDQIGHCGGLLMAAEEQPLGAWQDSLPRTPQFQVSWQAGKPLSFLLVAVLFLTFTFLFPQNLVSWTPEPPLAIGNEVERLAAQIDVLKQEAILDQTRAEFLKEKLKQLQDEASGKNPVKTLEALDHLRETLSQAAKDAAEAAIKKTEKLGQAEGLTEAVRQNEGALDAKVEKEALEELAALVHKASRETNLLDKHLDPELLKQLQEAKLTPEQMKKLAEALRGSRKDLAKMLGKLHGVKLIDADLLKKCEKAGDCNCAGLLKDQGGKMSVKEILALGQGNIPGKGGITEGPGSSPITWDQNTSEEGAKFKEETLPPAELARLKDSLLLGLGKTDPKNGKEVSPSQGGVLAGANKGGGSAITPTILPKHQPTVEKFFARPKQK
jgi:hypothetical protein